MTMHPSGLIYNEFYLYADKQREIIPPGMETYSLHHPAMQNAPIIITSSGYEENFCTDPWAKTCGEGKWIKRGYGDFTLDATGGYDSSCLEFATNPGSNRKIEFNQKTPGYLYVEYEKDDYSYYHVEDMNVNPTYREYESGFLQLTDIGEPFSLRLDVTRSVVMSDGFRNTKLIATLFDSKLNRVEGANIAFEMLFNLDPTEGPFPEGSHLVPGDLDGGDYGTYEADPYSLIFNGTSDYVRVPDDSVLYLGTEGTFCAWIKLYSTTEHYYDRTIVNKYDPDAKTGFVLRVGNGRLNVLAGDGTDFRLHGGAATLDLNEWVHVAVIVNSSGVTGYINGELDKYTEYSNLDLSCANDLMIGTHTTPTARWFDGEISDVRIYDTVRTQEQIQEDMYKIKTASEEGLAGHWSARSIDESKELIKNGNLDAWNDGDTSPPDGWTLSSGSIEKEHEEVRQGLFSAKVTCLLDSTLFFNNMFIEGSDIEKYKGNSVTAGIWVYCEHADRVRIRLSEASGQYNDSPNHTGSGWEFLEVTRLISESAEYVNFTCRIGTGSIIDVYFDGATAFRNPKMIDLSGNANHGVIFGAEHHIGLDSFVYETYSTTNKFGQATATLQPAENKKGWISIKAYYIASSGIFDYADIVCYRWSRNPFVLDFSLLDTLDYLSNTPWTPEGIIGYEPTWD